MVIKKATSTEIKSIKELLHITWSDSYSDCLSEATLNKISSSWHAADNLRNQIRDPNILFLIAKNNRERIIGLLSGRVSDPTEFNLDRLYIHPNFQGKGIGSKLFDHAVNSLPQLEKVFLEVIQQNKKGVRFWRKKGFSSFGQHKVEIGVDKVIVVKLYKNYDKR